MNAAKSILKRSVLFPLVLICFKLSAQVAEKTGVNADTAEEHSIAAPVIVLFSNSESPDLSFMVHTDLKACKLNIVTNYPDPFRIRFVDYWGRTVRVYRNVRSGDLIDVTEFKNQIVILNITDSRGKRLLSSQVVNLKRRNYWREGG